MASLSTDGLCPCGSSERYIECCGLFIDLAAVPATAEQLMRSRYSAYVRLREDYLLHTWHASTRPADLGLRDTAAVKWLGLKILRAEQGNAQQPQAEVEFVARYTINGKAERLHETSQFIREGDKWFYVDGKIIPK